MIYVPQDIISLIIEQHCFNDTHTLQAFSLVSSSCVAPSQKGLFHTIHLTHFLEAQEQCRRLHHVLTTNPKLATYVRKLHVAHHTITPDPIHWVGEEETLHAILQMLPHLRFISYERSPVDDHFRCLSDWTTMPAGLKSALTSAFSLPSLETCKIEGVKNLSPDIFNTFTHLKKLSLVVVFSFDFADEHPVAHAASPENRKIKLDSVELNHVFDLPGIMFSRIGSYIDFSGLRKVSVRSHELGYLWEVIRYTTGSLESLKWGPRFTNLHARFEPGNIDLSLFPRLRDIIFDFEDVGSRWDPFPWLLKSLQGIASRRASSIADGDNKFELQEITLLMRWSTDYTEPEFAAIGNPVWVDLDLLLSDSGKFPSLRAVTIYVCPLPPLLLQAIPRVFGASIGTMEESLSASLPALFQKGLLQVYPTSAPSLKHMLLGED